MRIGELARRTGVSERSLRYYEAEGLLRAERTAGGQRRYGEWAVDRVIRIQALYAAGLCSKKIVQLLPCMRDVDGGPSEIATAQLVDELSDERDRINRMIRDLLLSRDVLDEVIATAAAGVHASAVPRAGTVGPTTDSANRQRPRPARDTISASQHNPDGCGSSVAFNPGQMSG